MKSFLAPCSILCLTLAIAGTPVHGQVIIRSAGGSDSVHTLRFKADNVVILPEIGAVISVHGHDLKVDRIAPPESRVQAYKEIDIQQGDIVTLFNGTRVKNIDALRNAYHDLPTHETARVGLQRGDQLLSVSFPKADPKDLPNIRIIERKK